MPTNDTSAPLPASDAYGNYWFPSGALIVPPRNGRTKWIAFRPDGTVLNSDDASGYFDSPEAAAAALAKVGEGNG